MIVYLVRHGQTEYNRQGKLQGNTDVPLNEYGREVAYATAERIKDIPFDLVITSPLSRARETARILMGNRKVDILTDDRIREISFGEYEGCCYKGENCNVPDPHFMNFFDAPTEYTTPPGGESLQHIIERTGRFWRELCADKENVDKTILLSTHGCALKAILVNVCGTPLEHFWGKGCSGNCALTKVEVTGDGVTVTEDV